REMLILVAYSLWPHSATGAAARAGGLGVGHGTGARRPGARFHADLDPLAIPQHNQVQRVAGAAVRNDGHDLVERLDRLAVRLDDHVTMHRLLEAAVEGQRLATAQTGPRRR